MRARGVAFAETIVLSDGFNRWNWFVDLEGNKFQLVQRDPTSAGLGVLDLGWGGIFIENFDATVTWYDEVLGLDLVSPGMNAAKPATFTLTNGARLQLFGGGVASPTAKEAAAQSVTLGLQVADLDGTIAELELRGVDVDDHVGRWDGEDGWPGERWVDIRDPEGNRISIKQVID
jgi:predicted enzyme related to lactoylglutathione lyase